MKTNPLTSRLHNLYLYLGKHRKMSGCAGVPACFLFTIAAILLLLLPRCHHQQRKPPHARQQLPRLCTTHRDPRYHNLRCAIYRIPIIRISDRKITIHDIVFIARTDTLLRTQIITQKERYIPPFYRFAP